MVSARVSSVPDGSNSVEQGSPSFAIARSVSNSELLRSCLGSGICAIRSRIDSFLDISQPRMFVLDYSEIEFLIIKSMVAKKLYDVNFDDWSNYCSSWNRCVRSGSWVCSRKCIFSACWSASSKTIVHVRTGLVAHTRFYPGARTMPSSQNFCELYGFGQ